MSEQNFDVQALERAARGGNVDAQYRMAALAMSEQQADAGLTWLRKAASNNHRDARFTLANFYLRGEFVKQDIARAQTLLEQLHRADYAAASQQLASMQANGFGMERNWAGALDIVLDSAAAGRIGAMREVALLLILSGVEDALAHSLLLAAATRSDIHSAMILTVRMLSGDKRIAKSDIAFWVDGAKELGYPLAETYRAAFDTAAGQEPPAVTDSPAMEIKKLKLQLLKPEGSNCPAAKTLYDRPHVQHVAGFLAPEVCDYLVGYAAPGLQPAAWFNPESAAWEADPLRICMTRVFLPIDQPIAITAIAARMAGAAGLSAANGEIPTILYFKPGQQYHPHLDALPEEMAVSESELKRGGQRVKTATLTLNDTYEGGEIYFLRADLSLSHKKGSLFLHENTLADGTIDEQALYEHKPVTTGEKWVFSLALRADAFTLF